MNGIQRRRANDSETRFKRTWFGLSARVTMGPGFLHKAGFGGVVIPHPPVANRLLRLGLSAHSSRNLAFAHEFAHFETAPMLFVYGLAAFVLAYVKARTGMAEVIFLLVSVQAAWEITSEGFVLLSNSEAYRRIYDGVSRIPRILFWVAGGVLTVTGWIVVLHGWLPREI